MFNSVDRVVDVLPERHIILNNNTQLLRAWTLDIIEGVWDPSHERLDDNNILRPL